MNLFKKTLYLNLLSTIILCNVHANIPLLVEGAKSAGMGGCAVAMPQDSLVMITNPAGLSFIEDRYDLNVISIYSHTKAKIQDNFLIPKAKYDSTPTFYIPSAGIKKEYCSLALGLCAYGRGAGTNYGEPIPIFGTTKFYSLLNQYIIKPCLSWKFNENHAIGAGVDLAITQLKVEGLENFQLSSAYPSFVTNNGNDYKAGIGVHIGYLGRFFDKLKIGIAYDTKILTHRFNRYKGLFAERAKIDGPAIFTVGASYDITCRLVTAFDYQCVLWKNNRAFHNPLSFTDLLGTSKGSGLGFRNENRYKFGVAYTCTDSLTLRLGYIAVQPVYASDQLLFNVATTSSNPNNYFTGGFTWAWDCSEINFYCAQSLNRTISTELNPLLGGGRLETKSINSVMALSFGHRF
ncbi:outer membrane protein transport protein [Chlamydiales bacterium]|nr:outer membrane protein transport protein [Chlamydiales bacterium]